MTVQQMRRRWAVRALAAFALGLFSLDLSGAPPARRAVIVGINTYQWSGPVHKDPGQDFPNLTGAAGDAVWLKSILTSKYGFRDEDVVLLTDAAATRDAILNAFSTHLIGKSAPGDVAVFYFSGHGSQRGSGDAMEETIVPADSRDPAGKVFDIASSDLHGLFLQLLGKTRNVTSILDSCYSDTIVRDIVLTKSIRRDSRVAVAGETRARDVGFALNPITPVVRISASRADQESQEYTEFTRDGQTVQHGLMSYELFHELEAAGDQTTWRDVMDRTKTEVAKRNASQEPQLEAPDPDARIFGGAGLAASEPFLLVTPRRQNVGLNAGSMQTLATDTELDVFAPGTREFTGEPLARLRVTQVNASTSDANVVSGAAAREIPEGARAVVRKRPATSFRFRVFFAGSAPQVTAVRQAVLSTVAGAVESPITMANAVVRFAGGGLRTERPNGMVMSPAVPADEADAVGHVTRQLAAWARWHQLLAMEGNAALVRIKVTDESGTAVGSVADGAAITVALCNMGAQPYFTRVVYFASDGAVSPLELATDGAPLPAGQCRTGGSFHIAVEEGRKSGVEFFKAFATADKVDLEPFTSPGIRGDAPDADKWSSATLSLTVVTR